MERNLLKYVWVHSRRDQLWMLIIILLSMPTYFLSLELPKRLVNEPIQGIGFENPGDVAKFMRIEMPFGESITGSSVVLFNGIELERLGYLLALSITFLVLVVANGQFKLYINTYKGRMGERILRRLRFELFDRVLRYPMSRFRRTRPSEIASMIKDEVEPMGEFIGDAFTNPMLMAGQALVALLFIFLQHFWLGLATLVVVIFQAWLVPVLRRRLIELNKERQIVSRQFAGRLGEVVEGIQESHTNDTSNLERANIAEITGKLFLIRFELYQRKFTVKFINNFLIQFLAFFFYLVGGYMAIRGTLDIGQLIGVIVAYKDLPGPIKGLIDHDQKRNVVTVRYEQIVEQFTQDVLQDKELQAPPAEPVSRLSSGYEVSRLGVEDENGSQLIVNASTKIDLSERVAIVGTFGGGAAQFADVLSGILKPTSGRVLLDGKSIDSLPEYVTGRNIGYIYGSTYLPQASILDIMCYVLKNEPVRSLERNDQEQMHFDTFLQEARRAGVIEWDYAADWIDFERVGAKDSAEFSEQIFQVLEKVGLEGDVRALGLRGTLNPQEHPELCNALVDARNRFRGQLDSLGFSEFVEPFDPVKYNSQSSIGENLLFGTAIDPEFEPDNIASNTLVRSVLANDGLEENLFAMGKEVASTTIELFGDLNPDNPFFDQLSYMNPDDLPEYRAILTRIGNKPYDEVSDADQIAILKLPLAYTEDQNRLGLLDDNLKNKILEARSRLNTRLQELPEMPIAFYEPDSYNPAASVLDNVLLGRVSQSAAEGNERVSEAIQNLLEEMKLSDDIFRIGLNFNVGSGGKRLSETQRQKLHLARALLKKPDMLIVNQGMNSLGAREQKQIIETVLNESINYGDRKAGVVWVPVNPAFSEQFDRVIVFDNGEIVADGAPAELKKSSPVYQELIS